MSISAIVMFLVVCAGFVGVLYAIVRVVLRSSKPPPAQGDVTGQQPISNLTLPASVGTKSFHASSQSQMGKARRSLWLMMIVALAMSFLLNQGNPMTMVIITAIFLCFLLAMELLLRKRMKPGVAYVSLTREGVESPNLPGKVKTLRWQDISSVSFKSVQGNPYLEFSMRDSAGLPDRRSFWSGANPARPMLVLSALTQQDQEALLGAIQASLTYVSGGAIPPDKLLANDIREEREFVERLQALEPTTWMTHLLVALNIGIWLWTLTAGASLLQAPTERLLYWGGNAASEVQRGDWWRLLTSTFLHNGMMHVLMNMLGLYTAGVMVERIYGRNQFLLIYFGSGLLGSAASLHYSAQHAVSVGASGAVFGVTGALLVAYLQHRDKLPKASSKQMISGLGFFIVYALMQGFSKQGIDNAAHIGGLLGGCLLAYILPERFDLDHYKKTASRSFATGIAISAFLIAGAVHEAPQATVDQSRIFASVEILKQGFTHFQDAFKELQALHNNVQAGKLSEWDADVKGRIELAPKFQGVVNELRQVVLHPNDPRRDFLADTLRLSELVAESLAMESFQQEGDPKPKPANPERMAQMETEIRKIGERMAAHMEILNKKK